MEYLCTPLHSALCKCPSNEPIKSCGQFRLQYTETRSKCTKGRWDIWEGVSSFWIHHRRVKRQHCMQPRILQKARKEKVKKSSIHIFAFKRNYFHNVTHLMLTFMSVETTSKPPMTKRSGAITMSGSKE